MSRERPATTRTNRRPPRVREDAGVLSHPRRAPMVRGVAGCSRLIIVVSICVGDSRAARTAGVKAGDHGPGDHGGGDSTEYRDRRHLGR